MRYLPLTPEDRTVMLGRIGVGHDLRLPLLPLSAPHHAAADHLAGDIAALEALSSH